MLKTALVQINAPTELKQRAFEDAIEKALKEATCPDIAQLRDRTLLFDLSATMWHDLGTLLWFIALLHRLKSQRNDIQLVFPDPTRNQSSRNVWDFLLRWKFFEALASCVDDPRNLLPHGQHHLLTLESRYSTPRPMLDPSGTPVSVHTLRLLEIQTFFAQHVPLFNETIQNEKFETLTGPVMVTALSHLCGWEQVLAKMFLQSVVREGIINSIDHARGSFVNLAFRTDPKHLVLAISDNGVGIPRILRESLPELVRNLTDSSDTELIKFFTEAKIILDSQLVQWSTRQAVTSKGDRRGLGLYYLKEQVLRNGGELRIRSGKACVDFTRKGVDARELTSESSGTLIRVQAPRKE